MNKLPPFVFEVVVWLVRETEDKFYIFSLTDAKFYDVENISVKAVKIFLIDGWKIEKITCKNFKFLEYSDLVIFNRARWGDE